jgi:hypothetical protein
MEVRRNVSLNADSFLAIGLMLAAAVATTAAVY